MTSLNLPKSDAVYYQLITAYAESHRYYHTIDHIKDCLTQLDFVTSFLDSSAEVELALWFHDAVYQPQSITNEVDSANWAQHFLESCGATQEHSQRIYNHIIATKHDPQKLSKDSSFVVDIDLSILGRSQQKYQQFEQNIYLEYSWMPRPIFCRRRIEILEYFLMKSSIYNTEYFRGRYEKQARSNLLGAIEVLRNRSR